MAPAPSDAESDSPLRERVERVVGHPPTGIEELHGGMVGRVRRVDFAARPSVVAKTGDTPLDVEARMLRYLARESDLPVPEVVAADSDLLVLEYVDGDTDHDARVERDAADHLAALHDRTSDGRGFGFPFDTLTGPLDQPNPWTDSWPAFFGEHRLRHVTALAREAGTLDPSLAGRVDDVTTDLGALLREPPQPALVHGDVWTANVLARDGHVEAFLDPACYYADPEVELAYVAWTDTFGEAFVERYRERRGIDAGFERRRRVYDLYPLVVHVHLFGGRYRRLLADALADLGY